MSVDLVAITNKLLNPCKFADNTRQQDFVDASVQNVNAGSQLIFKVPNKSIIDFTEAYFDMNISFTNMVAEVPTIVTIQYGVTSAVPLSGGFYFQWQGFVSDSVPFNATQAQIQAGIESLPGFHSQGYRITNITGAAALSPASNAGIVVTIGSFNYWGYPFGGLTAVTQISDAANPHVAVVRVDVALTQAGVLSSPRLERFAPIFAQVQVQLNSLTPVDTVNWNVLYSIDCMIRPDIAQNERYYDEAELENGIGLTTQINSYNLKIETKKIGLFQTLLPLELMENPDLTIRIQLEQPQNCLIRANGTQSYTIANPKLHYHVISIDKVEKELIKAQIDGEGLVIPFRNWSGYDGNLAIGENQKKLIFNPSVSSLLGIYFVIYSTDYAQVQTNKRKITTYLKNGLSNYRLKVGNVYYPLRDIESSNTFQAQAEQIKELRNFSELVTFREDGGDMLCFDNFNGTITKTPAGFGAGPFTFTPGIGNDPTDQNYTSLYEQPVNMMCLFAISTSDIGFSTDQKMCMQSMLNGVNTRGLPNVQLELDGMVNIQNCKIDIFALHQDYLKIKRGGRGLNIEWTV